MNIHLFFDIIILVIILKQITKKIINKLSKLNKKKKKERKLKSIILKDKNIKYIDTYILIENKNIKVRLFIPKIINQTILYFHGGGFVSGNIQTYSRTCNDLASNTNSLVIAIDYSLAPEYPFPIGLKECYEVTKYFYSKDSFVDNIVLMGDSAGGNIASVISIIASEKKEFKVDRQILLYPITYHIHDENSSYKSIKENGYDYILTNERINQYLDLYVKDKKYLTSKYVSPLNADSLYNQPKTLIITANLDPLRDEGEEYGKKLLKYNNQVTLHRIDNIHGFFTLPINKKEINECYNYINEFLGSDNIETMV